MRSEVVGGKSLPTFPDVTAGSAANACEVATGGAGTVGSMDDSGCGVGQVGVSGEAADDAVSVAAVGSAADLAAAADRRAAAEAARGIGDSRVARRMAARSRRQ